MSSSPGTLNELCHSVELLSWLQFLKVWAMADCGQMTADVHSLTLQNALPERVVLTDNTQQEGTVLGDPGNSST